MKWRNDRENNVEYITQKNCIRYIFVFVAIKIMEMGKEKKKSNKKDEKENKLKSIIWFYYKIRKYLVIPDMNHRKMKYIASSL